MRESGFDTFFEGFDHVELFGGGEEEEGDLDLSEHVEDFVEKYLFCVLNIVINILKNEEHQRLALPLFSFSFELLFHQVFELSEHITLVMQQIRVHLEHIEELDQQRILLIIQNRIDSEHNQSLPIKLLLTLNLHPYILLQLRHKRYQQLI